VSHQYEIEEETNAIRVYYDNSDVPGLFQPEWPNGEPWANREEAEEWAKLFIDVMENQILPYTPGTREEFEEFKKSIS
jgi:hypothetical protein